MGLLVRAHRAVLGEAWDAWLTGLSTLPSLPGGSMGALSPAHVGIVPGLTLLSFNGPTCTYSQETRKHP